MTINEIVIRAIARAKALGEAVYVVYENKAFDIATSADLSGFYAGFEPLAKAMPNGKFINLK